MGIMMLFIVYSVTQIPRCFKHFIYNHEFVGSYNLGTR